MGSLRSSSEKFKAAGSQKKDAKLYDNCINDVLICGNDEDEIIKHLAPPELHLMEGATNHIVKAIIKNGGSQVQDEIAKQLNISRCIQNNAFNGNASRKILKNWHIYQDKLPVHLKPFAEGLRLLDKVVTSCFSLALLPEFEESVDRFIRHYKTLIEDFGITVTVKLHIIFNHVPSFCKKTGLGLGFFSEQATEAINYSFIQEAWERFRVSNNHAEYGEHLRKAVVSYNSKHLVNICKDVHEII